METIVGLFLSWVFGAGFTFAVSWLRERRRNKDAYRAPQRAAIGDLLAATDEFMLCQSDQRLVMGDLLEQVRQDRELVTKDESDAVMKAAGRALFNVNRALWIGRLTIIDAPCWEALGIAVVEFDHLRAVIGAKADAEALSIEEVEQHLESIEAHAARFKKSVDALATVAAERVTPAETLRNVKQRNAARGRIGQHLQKRLGL